jgi:chromosomal replication initiation ATPase DnaA
MRNQPMIEKLLAMRLHGRGLESTGTRSRGERAQFPRTTRSARGSAMELAREPGVGTKTESGQTCRERPAWRTLIIGPVRGLEKTVMRALAKDSAWVRNHENIFVIGPCGLGKSSLASAAESMSRRVLRTLSPRRCPVSGTSPGPSRWQLASLLGTAESHRCSGHQ